MNELVTLKVFDNSIDAHLIKSKLESEGIPSVLFDENIVSLDPLSNKYIGGIKLRVSSNDFPKAQDVLKAIDFTPYLNGKDEVLKCPHCGSTDFYSNFKSTKGVKGKLSMLLSFILLIFPLSYKIVYKCKNCEEEFSSS